MQFYEFPKHWPCYFVPHNTIVTGQLTEKSIRDFPYIHVNKTQIMEKFIPTKKLGNYSTEDIFYIYQYVDLHKLGFSNLPDKERLKFGQSLWGMMSDFHGDYVYALRTKFIPHPTTLESQEDLLNKVMAIHRKVGVTYSAY